MIIESIAFRNLGPYRGEVEIPLAPVRKQSPITLVTARNGAGKTTLLDAINLCLYGKHANLAKQGEMPYAEFLHNLIWSDGETQEEEAFIRLKLRYQRQGSRRYEIVERRWTKAGREECRILVRNEQGRFDEDLLLSERSFEHVEELLPLQLAPLFFFDGEQIKELADPKRSAEVLRTALDGLLGLGLIRNLEGDLNQLTAKTRRENARGDQVEAAEQAELLLHQLEAAEDRVRRMETEEVALRTLEAQLDSRLKVLDRELSANGGDLIARRVEIEKARALAEQEAGQAMERLRALLAGDLPLLLVRDQLATLRSLDQQERQHRLTGALDDLLGQRDRLFLDWLRPRVPDPLLSETSAHLQQDRDKRRIGAETIAPLGFDDTTSATLDDVGTERLAQLHAQFAANLGDVERLRQQAEEQRRLLGRIPAPDTLHNLLHEQAQARAELAANREKTVESAKHLQEALIDRDRLRKQYERRMDDLGARGVDDDRLTRRLTMADATVKVLERFRSRVLGLHLASIERRIAQLYSQLIDKRNLVAGVRIDPATFRISLVEGKGARSQEKPLNKLSSGERQLLATAILWGLAKESGRPLPVVIDTPMARLDEGHRDNLVRHYYPNIAGQVVLLSTDTEIVGRHLKNLSSSIGRRITLHHNDEEHLTTVKVDGQEIAS